MAKLQHDSKTKLLHATLKVVRAKGHTATRIEDVCAEAGLTKEVSSTTSTRKIWRWRQQGTGKPRRRNFSQMPPIIARPTRLIGWSRMLIFARRSSRANWPSSRALSGQSFQEAYQTHPEINAACAKSITHHAKTLEARHSRGDAAIRRARQLVRRASHFTSGGHPGRIHTRQSEEEALLSRRRASIICVDISSSCLIRDRTHSRDPKEKATRMIDRACGAVAKHTRRFQMIIASSIPWACWRVRCRDRER